MKKTVIFGSFLLFVSGGLMSCKKCSECHYEAMENGSEVEVELGEYCDEELETLEADGYSVNDSTVVEVHCHEH